MENRSTFHYISTASTEKMWLENLDPASHGRIFFRKNEGACGGGWKIRIWRQNHAEIPNFNPYFAVLWGFIRKEAWWLTTDDVVVWRQMAAKSEEVIKPCRAWSGVGWEINQRDELSEFISLSDWPDWDSGESFQDYLWQIAASKLNITDKWTEIW